MTEERGLAAEVRQKAEELNVALAELKSDMDFLNQTIDSRKGQIGTFTLRKTCWKIIEAEKKYSILCGLHLSMVEVLKTNTTIADDKASKYLTIIKRALSGIGRVKKLIVEVRDGLGGGGVN